MNGMLYAFKTSRKCYNSAIFRIVSQLKFCGMDITDEEMLEKTYSIFHASAIAISVTWF